MSADELHDYDGPGLPSVAETGREFVCLPRAELDELRAIKSRAQAMVANNALESRRQAAHIILGI